MNKGIVAGIILISTNTYAGKTITMPEECLVNQMRFNSAFNAAKALKEQKEKLQKLLDETNEKIKEYEKNTIEYRDKSVECIEKNKPHK